MKNISLSITYAKLIPVRDVKVSSYVLGAAGNEVGFPAQVFVNTIQIVVVGYVRKDYR